MRGGTWRHAAGGAAIAREHQNAARAHGEVYARAREYLDVALASLGVRSSVLDDPITDVDAAWLYMYGEPASSTVAKTARRLEQPRVDAGRILSSRNGGSVGRRFLFSFFLFQCYLY